MEIRRKGQGYCQPERFPQVVSSGREFAATSAPLCCVVLSACLRVQVFIQSSYMTQDPCVHNMEGSA